jgi:transcriptional regulator with XRE-family HTH domain
MLNQRQLGKKIKFLRNEQNLSQEKLAKLVNISRASLSELERGNRNLSALELAKIAKVFRLSTDELLREEKKKNKKMKIKKGNKSIEFKPHKLKELILYILSKCGGKPNFGETVLYKLLYFIDFDSYELLKKPITGMNYVHQKFGPIPQLKQYQPNIQEMKKNQDIKIFNQDYYGMNQKRYVALKDYNLDSFSEKEKKIINDVLSLLSNMSATQIENYAHGDKPWSETEKNQVISYELVNIRELPYKKYSEEQLWDDAANLDTLETLGEMSKEEYNYYKNL